MKDTFLTTSYKEGFIHTCHNRATGCEEVQAQVFGHTADMPSVAAAKRHIMDIMEYDLALKTGPALMNRLRNL